MSYEDTHTRSSARSHPALVEAYRVWYRDRTISRKYVEDNLVPVLTPTELGIFLESIEIFSLGNKMAIVAREDGSIVYAATDGTPVEMHESAPKHEQRKGLCRFGCPACLNMLARHNASMAMQLLCDLSEEERGPDAHGRRSALVRNLVARITWGWPEEAIRVWALEMGLVEKTVITWRSRCRAYLEEAQIDVTIAPPYETKKKYPRKRAAATPKKLDPSKGGVSADYVIDELEGKEEELPADSKNGKLPTPIRILMIKRNLLRKQLQEMETAIVEALEMYV